MVGKKYLALIERFPLRPLRTEAELDKALAISLEMYERLESLSNDEEDYLEVLSDLIVVYESKHYPVEPLKPFEHLRECMREHKMKQPDLQKLLGVPQGRASELMNGVRELSKQQVMILSKAFKVSPELFLPKRREAVTALTFRDSKKRVNVVEKFVMETFEQARESGNTYWIDCDGINSMVSRNSDVDLLLKEYKQSFSKAKKSDKSEISASRVWYE